MHPEVSLGGSVPKHIDAVRVFEPIPPPDIMVIVVRWLSWSKPANLSVGLLSTDHSPDVKMVLAFVCRNEDEISRLDRHELFKVFDVMILELVCAVASLAPLKPV